MLLPPFKLPRALSGRPDKLPNPPPYLPAAVSDLCWGCIRVGAAKGNRVGMCVRSGTTACRSSADLNGKTWPWHHTLRKGEHRCHPPRVQGTCLVPELQLFAHQKRAALSPSWWDLGRGEQWESLSLHFCSLKQAPRQAITSWWKCNNSDVSHGGALLHSLGCYGMSDRPPVPTARSLNSSSLWNSSTPRTIQSVEADLTFPWKRYNGLACVAITYVHLYMYAYTCRLLPKTASNWWTAIWAILFSWQIKGTELWINR